MRGRVGLVQPPLSLVRAQTGDDQCCNDHDSRQPSESWWPFNGYLGEPRDWEIDGDPLARLWGQPKHHLEKYILKFRKFDIFLLYNRVMTFVDPLAWV